MTRLLVWIVWSIAIGGTGAWVEYEQGAKELLLCQRAADRLRDRVVDPSALFMGPSTP